MKKIKLFILLLLAVMIIPFSVFAEGEEEAQVDSEATNEVPVYFFRGEGCPHCQEAEEWFASIEEELGSKFKIVDYETWYDSDNQELMSKVEEARGEEAGGVPYIIIGDKSWIGFAEEYEDEIKSQINAVYEQAEDNRYDIMKMLDVDTSKKKTDSSKGAGGDVVALIIIVVVCIAIGLGINFARKNTD